MTDQELWDYCSSKETKETAPKKEIELDEEFKQWVKEEKSKKKKGKRDKELDYLNDWENHIW